MKIVIADHPQALGQEAVRQKGRLEQLLPGAEVQICPVRDGDQLVRAAGDAEGILTAFFPLERSVLEQLPRCRAISVSATGYGNVDVTAAGQLGIKVCALGAYCVEEVADHALAMMLSLLRSIKEEDGLVQRGQWAAGPRVPLLFSSVILGIYGFGRIGRALAKRGLGLGMRVLTLDRPAAQNHALPGVELVPEGVLLAQCNVISNHMPLTQETVNYFDRARFFNMGANPIFLNLGRGESVDEMALAEALRVGRLSGAGLDVLRGEPPSLEGNPLLGLDQVLLTPHTGFRSTNALRVVEELPCRNLAGCLLGQMDMVQVLVSQ